MRHAVSVFFFLVAVLIAPGFVHGQGVQEAASRLRELERQLRDAQVDLGGASVDDGYKSSPAGQSLLDAAEARLQEETSRYEDKRSERMSLERELSSLERDTSMPASERAMQISSLRGRIADAQMAERMYQNAVSRERSNVEQIRRNNEQARIKHERAQARVEQLTEQVAQARAQLERAREAERELREAERLRQQEEQRRIAEEAQRKAAEAQQEESRRRQQQQGGTPAGTPRQTPSPAAKPAAPAASPAAPAANSPSAADLETLRTLAQRVQTLARDGALDAKAKQAGASEVLSALAPLTAKYPEAIEFHVVQGYAAVIAGDEAAGRKAGRTITRLGGDRGTEGATKNVLDALRETGWIEAPASTPGTLKPIGVPDMPIVYAKETRGGLLIEDMKIGDGYEIKTGGFIVVHYHGTLKDNGTVFDSSFDRGQPVAFPLTGVIRGWQEGVPGMKVGGIRKITIPSAMAFGDKGNRPAIPAKADLVYVIQLIDAVQIEDLKVGDGETIGERAIVVAAQSMRTSDGREVEVATKEKPFVWIPGEHEAITSSLVGARVGGKRRIVLPAMVNQTNPAGQNANSRPRDVPLTIVIEPLAVKNMPSNPEK